MWRKREVLNKEEIIIPCNFCQATSVGHFNKTYFCASNDCSLKLWADQKPKEKPQELEPKRKKKRMKLTRKKYKK